MMSVSLEATTVAEMRISSLRGSSVIMTNLGVRIISYASDPPDVRESFKELLAISPSLTTVELPS